MYDVTHLQMMSWDQFVQAMSFLLRSNDCYSSSPVDAVCHRIISKYQSRKCFLHGPKNILSAKLNPHPMKPFLQSKRSPPLLAGSRCLAGFFAGHFESITLTIVHILYKSNILVFLEIKIK